MSRQQAFESIYAKQHDVPAESLVQYRHKSKEGYNLPGIASHYRTYCEVMDSEEIQGLRKDKERLDALEANFWDVRNITSENRDGGDSSVRIEIVGHWMEKPWERVIGENYNENLRAAIDQAVTADAYPPERPEYEEDEL